MKRLMSASIKCFTIPFKCPLDNSQGCNKHYKNLNSSITMKKILKNTLLVLFCKLFIVNARYHRAVNVDNHVMPQGKLSTEKYKFI